MLSGYYFDWHNNSPIPSGCISNEILKWNENDAFIWRTHTLTFVKSMSNCPMEIFFAVEAEIWYFFGEKLKYYTKNVDGKYHIQFQYGHYIK